MRASGGWSTRPSSAARGRSLALSTPRRLKGRMCLPLWPHLTPPTWCERGICNCIALCMFGAFLPSVFLSFGIRSGRMTTRLRRPRRTTPARTDTPPFPLTSTPRRRAPQRRVVRRASRTVRKPKVGRLAPDTYRCMKHFLLLIYFFLTSGRGSGPV